MINLINITELKDLDKGEFFKLTPDSKKVWVKGDYDRSQKKFSCINAENINNERFFKSSQVIWQGFEY